MSQFWQIFSAVLYAMNMCIAVYASLTMILRRQDPVKTLSWTAVLILFPYAGVILYLVFGQNYRKKKIFSRKGLTDVSLKKEMCSDEAARLKREPALFVNTALEPFKKLIYQNLRNSYSLVDFNSDIDFYFTGRSALEAMYEAIKGAKHHIHLQTYIFENDITGEHFTRLLIKKAAEGVEVRLMFDGVGSFNVKRKFINYLRANNIEVLVFSPVRFFMPMSKVNYRNHRKLLVVDGEVGFIGGINIADRYYYGTKTGDWHDTQIRIVGESVMSLQASFLLDRYFVINRKLRHNRKYYPDIQNIGTAKPVGIKDFYSQIISSGPDSDWAGIMQCYFTAITSAQKHIFIVSPYFTPNETILNALKVAALGEIDVRIMLPKVSDSLSAKYSTYSYIGELLDAGAKVYLFKQGFNHSKVISIDGKMCIIGSANMDVRSFEHNFEIMSALYNDKCAKVIEDKFIADMRQCESILPAKWKKRSAGEKVKESFFRLLGPLM